MKAMILAAGKSTRLGRLGAALPKPMLPLRGRPVLDWTLDRLRAAGVREVVINLHHAPEVIPAHLGDGAARGLRIAYSVEQDIQGTAGALRAARALLDDGEPFLVIYGDTVLDWDPVSMIRSHRLRRPMGTVVVAEVADPSRLGVVRLGQDDRIEAFVEKPGHRPELGRWVNAGLCILEPRVFDHIPREGFSDLGSDIFPALLECGRELRAYRRPRPLLVLDTPEQYAAAQRTWEPPA
jgi:NDP-sugar pyrophosphorylase family protein